MPNPILKYQPLGGVTRTVGPITTSVCGNGDDEGTPILDYHPGGGPTTGSGTIGQRNGYLYYWPDIDNLTGSVPQTDLEAQDISVLPSESLIIVITGVDGDETHWRRMPDPSSPVTDLGLGIIVPINYDSTTRPWVLLQELTGTGGGAANAFGTITIDGTNIVADSVSDTLTLIAGSNITFTPNALTDSLTIAASGGGGTGSSMSSTITQTSHGFIVGDVLKYTGTIYAKAQADTAANAEVVGLVTAVGASTFTLTTGGAVTGLSGLTAGSIYFLSAGTAGLLTTTVPSVTDQVSKPLLVATSATTGYFFNWRGWIVGSSAVGGGGGGGIPGGLTTQLQYNNAGAFGGATNVTTDGTSLIIKGATADSVSIASNQDDITLRNTVPNTATYFRVMPNGSVANFPSAFTFYGTDRVADPSNYERMFIYGKGTADSYYVLGTDAAGTGIRRPLLITSDGSSTQMLFSTTGDVSVGTSISGPGTVPVGGTTNQVLSKTSNANYAVGWATPAGGGNVSSVPTPTSGQLALWTGGTTIQGLTALPAANFPALTGDVTTTAGSLATTIGANKVTLVMMATMATDSILGRATVSTGNVEVLAALPFAWSGGDITRAADSNTETINANAVTYAKMQNVSANSRLLGSGSAGTGLPPAEITVGSGLTMTGTTLTASGGAGTVTSITATSPIVVTPTPLTATGVFTLDKTVDLAMTAAQTVTVSDAIASVTDALTISHNSTGTPGANFGTGLLFKAEDSTTNDTSLGEIQAVWTNATHNSNVSKFVFRLLSGGLSLGGAATLTGTGLFDVSSGFTILASALTGKILQGDGTKFTASAPTWPTSASTANKVIKSDGTNLVMSTETYAVPGTAGQVLRSNATNWLSAALNFSDLTGSYTLAQGPSITAGKLLGRDVGSAGIPQEITLGTNLSMSGTTLNATGGGGGTPGGTDTLMQYNNAGAFGACPTLAYNNSTVVLTMIGGTKLNLIDNTDNTKKANFDVSNIATATTRTVNIPNANSTTVQADTGAANNFLTAVSAQGVISKARPAFTDISGSVASTQMPAYTGDVSSSAGATVNTIGANKVTLAMMAAMSTDSILGRKTAATGNVEELTALPFAYTGDVTRAVDSNTTVLANIPLTTTIAGVAGTRGDVLYYGASGWAKLAAGTSGNQLTTNGAGADPTWAAPGSGGSGSPGGSTLQLQYNNAGAFGGMSGTSWDDTNCSLTLTGATVTTSKPIFDLAQTWNASGIVFTGLKVNVTNTASAAGSALADFQTGGVSQTKIRHDGFIDIKTGIGITSAGSYFYDAADGYITLLAGGAGLKITHTANHWTFSDANGLVVASNRSIGWQTGTAPATSAPDTALARNAAGVVEINNGTAGTYRDLRARIINVSNAIQLNGVSLGSDYYFSNTASVTPSTADLYLTASAITVPAGGFAARGQYHCVFDVVKSAGTGAIVLTVRIGTLGTTGDTSRMTFTFGAGTSVADTGTFEVFVNWRSVGSGTSAVIAGFCRAQHNLATTGLFNNAAVWTIVGTVSGGFDSSAATTIGLSFNGSTAFAGTITTIQTTLVQ